MPRGNRTERRGRPPAKPLHERHIKGLKVSAHIDIGVAPLLADLMLHGVAGVVTPDEMIEWLIVYASQHTEIFYSAAADAAHGE